MAINEIDVPRLKRELLALMAQDYSLTKARQRLGISLYYLKNWRQTDLDFDAAITEQQEARIERDFDALDEALERWPNPQQAKVFSDNLKWKLAKLDPARFGDAINLKTTHTIDLTDRFARALERLTIDRLRPYRDPDAVIDAQAIDVTAETAANPADTKSDSASDPIILPPADRLTSADGTGGTRGSREGGGVPPGPPAPGASAHLTSPPETPARPET